jgi:iron complex outermembrane receptor protein
MQRAFGSFRGEKRRLSGLTIKTETRSALPHSPMNRKLRFMILLFAGVFARLSDAKAQGPEGDARAFRPEISGRVVNADTRRPVVGATVVIDDREQGALTDSAGDFTIAGLEPGEHTLRVKHPGYLDQVAEIVSPTNQELSILLSPVPDLREQVTVTAVPWAAERQSVAQMTDSVDMAVQRGRSGLSLGEAIKDIPGVRNVSTGEAGGVPMIRGLTNDRVRVLVGGVPHDYFQFSRRHMPNVDPYEASAIEVVRGPGSVLYGSQAVGGVINLIPQPLLEAEGDRPAFGGELLLGYGESSEAWVGRGELSLAYKRFSGRVAWTKRSSDDISSPAGPLPNTDYDQGSALAEAGVGFGKARLRGRYQHWENDLGFFVPTAPDFRLGLRNQIGHVEAALPAGWGEWQLAADLSQNVRRSYPSGFSQGAAVDLELDTQVYRAALRHNAGDQCPLRGWLQLEYGRQENKTFGPVPLLPRFRNRTWAVALYEELPLRRSDQEKWIVSFGLRYDYRKLLAPPGKLGIDTPIRKSYQPLTGSIGLVYRFTPALSAGFSLARGWRNPSEFELFADGPHDGVALYEKGAQDLRPETNVNTEVSLRWQGNRLRGSLAAFRCAFDDYIYLRLTGEARGDLPVAVFDQSKATLRGAEASLSFDASRILTVSTTAERLRTRNDSTGFRLPFSPPDRVAAALRFHPTGSAKWSSPYAELRATCAAEGRIAGPDEPFPVNTAGYAVLDLGSGVQRVLGDTIVSVDIWVSNLTNRAYRDFLDTYKAYAYSPGRNVRVTMRWLF